MTTDHNSAYKSRTTTFDESVAKMPVGKRHRDYDKYSLENDDKKHPAKRTPKNGKKEDDEQKPPMKGTPDNLGEYLPTLDDDNGRSNNVAKSKSSDSNYIEI